MRSLLARITGAVLLSFIYLAVISIQQVSADPIYTSDRRLIRTIGKIGEYVDPNNTEVVQESFGPGDAPSTPFEAWSSTVFDDASWSAMGAVGRVSQGSQLDASSMSGNCTARADIWKNTADPNKFTQVKSSSMFLIVFELLEAHSYNFDRQLVVADCSLPISNCEGRVKLGVWDGTGFSNLIIDETFHTGVNRTSSGTLGPGTYALQVYAYTMLRAAGLGGTIGIEGGVTRWDFNFDIEEARGDIFVLDASPPFHNILRVDPSTGLRTLLSDLDDPSQGPIGYAYDLEVDSSGDIVILSQHWEGGVMVGVSLMKIDPVTGLRTVLHELNDSAQGQIVRYPSDIAIDDSGNILCIDSFFYLLIKIDPATGFRTVLSDFNDPNQGPLVVPGASGVAVDATGNIMVTDHGPGISGVLLSVDPSTGFRTVLSDFGDTNQGPLGYDPGRMAVEATGDILVTEYIYGTLVRVDPSTGDRTLITDYDWPLWLADVAVEAPGDILVTMIDDNNWERELHRIDPLTGLSTILSDFNDPSQGQIGWSPQRVAVAPVRLDNTPVGFNVVVELFDSTTNTLVTITFPEVTQEGITTLATTTEGPPPPENYEQALADLFYNISTSAFADVGGEDLLAEFLKLDIIDPDDPEDWQVMVRVADEWIPLPTQAESVESGVKVTFTLSIEHLKTSLFGIFKPVTVPVAIDIKPGSYPNSINLGSHGNVPVAILSSAEFDATTVDPTTVTLANAAVKLKGKGTPMASAEDVNGDGLLDLVVHVSTDALDLTDSDEEAILRGEVFGGALVVVGSDTIRVVP
jgi:hypothetical protein